MAFVPAKCTQCGANIEVDDSHEAGICKYCGTAFVTEKAVNNYHNSFNIQNATIHVTGLDINNLLLRAAQFEEQNNDEKAIEYYNRVLDIDATHPVAKLGIRRLTKVYIGNTAVSREDMDMIEEALQRGQKVEAIRIVRLLSGLGLSDAKAFVESLPNGNTPCSVKKKQSGGCYIATAVYGSYDCPQVWILRRFRDEVLSTNCFGRTFIRLYYATSPTLVRWFGNKKWFKYLWKKQLDKIILFLQDRGFDSSLYTDKKH